MADCLTTCIHILCFGVHVVQSNEMCTAVVVNELAVWTFSHEASSVCSEACMEISWNALLVICFSYII